MSVVVIRADASKEIGGGHIYRCLTLADVLAAKGMYVHFICRKEAGNLTQYIYQRGFAVSVIKAPPPFSQTQDALVCRELIESIAPTLLVVDHYQIDAQWHKALSPLCQNILVIDDLANRPLECDLLFDQSLGRTPEQYQPWLNERCERLITGANNALLRPQFLAAQKQALNKRQATQKVEKILVAMGATDPVNATMDVLRQLDSEQFQITVILTDKAKYLDAVKQYAADTSIHCLVNVENMAEQMLNADIAIAAAGTSMLERCSLGLPSVLVCLADNQRHIAQATRQSGCAIAVIELADIESKLTTIINDFSKDTARYQQVSQKAFAVCDGQGVNYLSAQIEATLAVPKLYLDAVQATDMMDLFEWQQASETRRFSRDPKPPSLAQHRSWFNKVMKNRDIFFYIIKDLRQKCGYVRIHAVDDGYEVSIALAPTAYGRGLGHRALKLLGQLHFDKNLLAYIEPENVGSIKAFAKAGFVATGENWYQLKRDAV